MTATYSLKTYSFRTQPSPLETQPGIHSYLCVVPVSAIPTAFQSWMDVNARESSLSGKVPKAIRATLNDAPESFVIFNRGLAILAESVTYDNQKKETLISLNDSKKHGIFDGGHTLAVILDNRQNTITNGDADINQEAYCRVEILTGVPENMIADLVDARNTSKQVASKSLMNLEGKFNALKEALGPSIADLISWKENTDAPVDVREVVALLTALDRDNYSDSNHPIVAYSGKESCLNQFDSRNSSYVKLYSIAKDILNLWDLIQSEVPAQYNKDQGGKFGKLKGCNLLKNPRVLPILGGTTDYEFPNGYLYPIIAAFRSMLVEEKGRYKWGKDINPSKLVKDGLANKIFIGSVLNHIKEYHNPNRTGKDVNVWALAFQIAENYYLKI